MAHDDRLSVLVLDAQKRVFRLAERDYGLTFKALSLDSGIAYNSIRNYAHGETVMSVVALLKLAGVIPNELLSQLLEPVKKAIVDAQPEDGDFDAVVPDCVTYLNEYTGARHPNSPAGVDLAPCEKARLSTVRAQLKARA